MQSLTLIIFHILILILTIKISYKLKFFDIPNQRKIHKKKIIHTGGIAIFFTYIIILANLELNTEIENLIAVGSILVIFGFIDDQYKLTPGMKLFFIFLPILYLISEGLYLEDLGEYKHIGRIELNKFAIIFTLLSVALLVNSINYLDGIDGLCLIIVISSLIYFSIITNNENTKQLLTFLSIPLFINLFFNLLPYKTNYKIFLGNSGSLFFGFFLSFLMIYFYKFEGISPAKLIWPGWLPVFDFLYVNYSRIINNKSIFRPSKDHIHHIILEYLKNNLISLFYISIINIFIIFLGFAICKFLGNIYALAFFVILFGVYFVLRKNFKIKKMR